MKQQVVQVVLICVQTALEACLSRVKSRDQSAHINVSDAHVMAINAQVMDKAWAFDGEIDNNKASAEDILHSFKKKWKVSALGRKNLLTKPLNLSKRKTV